MKKKFSMALSLAMIMALTLTSLALAAGTAHISFTADAPCAVNVLVSYTNVAGVLVSNENRSTPTIPPVDVTPATSVTFSYSALVVCSNGNTYNFVSASPASPLIAGADTVTTTVVGHYAVVDTVPPVIAAHADVTAEATSAQGALVNYTAPATSDAVDGPGIATCVPASGSLFPLGDTIVNCNAVDAAGNHAVQTSFVVHVVDTTAPVIALHGDLTVEATSLLNTIVSYTAPATSDAVTGAGIATCVPASGTQFVLGDTPVICNAVDAAGNQAAPTSFVVHVVDTTAPVIAPHGDVTAEATSATGAIVGYTAPATSDAVAGAGTATCIPASGSQFGLGNTSVACTAADAHGNVAISTNFIAHVVDTTAPTLTLPADITVPAVNASGAPVSFTVSSNDLVDGPVAVTCSPVSGSVFPVGTTLVTCSATDAHANTASGNFNVTVTAVDTTPPILTLPADMTVEAVNAGGAPVNFTVSANDLVDGAVAVTCSPVSGSIFPLGATLVNCSAADSHNNSANGSFTVTVVDTTPPTLILPANITVTAVNASGTAVSFTIVANDLVDGPVAVTCSPISGSTFPIGATIVNCSATDAHANTANGSFTVSVQFAPAGEDCEDGPGHEILQPINKDGSSEFQEGSTIPAKFEVCSDDNHEIEDEDVVKDFKLIKIIHNDKVIDVNVEVLSTTPHDHFRSGNQQWIFNIDTKNLNAGNTYVYLVTLKDGSTIQFQYALK